MPFPELTVGEDLKWASLVAHKIATSARAGRPGQVLYYYEFSPHKNAKIPMQESPPRILSPRRAARKAEREAQRAQRVPMSDSFNHEAIFTPQYTDCSGPGSALSSTVPYREFLAAFVREHGVRSILDLGCGDFEVMSHVDIGETSYLGVDVIVERISRNVRKANVMKLHRHHFAVGDARTWPISNFDLVICKDVVQHWSNAEVTAWLARLAFAPPQGPTSWTARHLPKGSAESRSSRPRYALVTNCNYGPTVNHDVAAGGWRAVDLTKPPFGVGEVVFTWEFGGATKDVVLVESWRRRGRQ